MCLRREALFTHPMKSILLSSLFVLLGFVVGGGFRGKGLNSSRFLRKGQGDFMTQGTSQGKKLLSAVQMAVGRIFSGIKKKEPNLYQIWNEQVLAIGQKPVTRMTELMARDLNEGGIPIQQQGGNDINTASDEGDMNTGMARTMAQMVRDFAAQQKMTYDQFSKRETELLLEIQDLKRKLVGVKEHVESRGQDPAKMD